MSTKECPYAKSDTTPCYLKDGKLAVGMASVGLGAGRGIKVCVGCERGIGLLSAQRPKPKQAGPPT